ncbi:transposase [Mucilaginibacter terrenus]|uniref:Transposase n=2 Tax=Mucilaginibacter terrenus TaxID=2482727 RepID=A0A3E2NN04_9SPHI|nr:transposase [Mucilaginibacter terrenus]
MATINFDYHPQFFTAMILNWMPLLKDDAFKDIIIKSLRFLTTEGSIVVYGFVVMPNHIHLIWQVQDGFNKAAVQLRFMKFTAQQMKFRLLDSDDTLLSAFLVDARDRRYQFWERNPLSVDLWTPNVFYQKLDYIHNNPLQEKWRLATLPEEYIYSSARFYRTGIDDFGFLTHHDGQDLRPIVSR